jgi:hypothetical protein
MHAASEIAARAAAAGLAPQRYWTPDIHVAAFALPPCIAALLPGPSGAACQPG